MSRTDIDIQWIERVMAGLLAEHPEMAEDEILRADMLVGCTNADEILRRLVFELITDIAMAEGVAESIGKLKERQARFERRQDAIRSLMQRVMDAAQIGKIQLPEATLSMRPGVARVVIADEKAIPERFIVTTTSISKAAIKEAIKDGITIEGAYLSNAPPSLSVRLS
jgi:hypothetical protein